MGARGQGAGSRLQSHGAIAAASAGAEGQPTGVLACGPIQGAAAGVADAERLRGGVTAPLDRGEREARGTRAMAGTGAAVTVKATGTVTGVVAPLGHSVTWPL